MKIKWYGHACFLLTSEAGVKILTDPFNEEVGYVLPREDADIVTTSHDHYDHNNIGIVTGAFKHIHRTGSYSLSGVEILGIDTYHDEERGAKRGSNVIYRYVIDGVSVCHCGDIGHRLSAEQAAAIGSVDVLMVPVGGTYTVDYAGAIEIMKLLKPAVTIPMHFKTEALGFVIDDVYKFLSAAGGGERIGKQEIEITREKIAAYSPIVVLDYK